jgi:hypothetical protein
MSAEPVAAPAPDYDVVEAPEVAASLAADGSASGPADRFVHG